MLLTSAWINLQWQEQSVLKMELSMLRIQEEILQSLFPSVTSLKWHSRDQGPSRDRGDPPHYENKDACISYKMIMKGSHPWLTMCGVDNVSLYLCMCYSIVVY